MSSTHASASAEEESAKGHGGDRADSTPTEEVPTVQATGTGEGFGRPEDSVANPFPDVMDGDSSSGGSETGNLILHSLAKEAEVPQTSSCRLATVTEVSEDEADSNDVARCVVSSTYVLQMSKEFGVSFVFSLFLICY